MDELKALKIGVTVDDVEKAAQAHDNTVALLKAVVDDINTKMLEKQKNAAANGGTVDWKTLVHEFELPNDGSILADMFWENMNPILAAAGLEAKPDATITNQYDVFRRAKAAETTA